MYQHPEKFNLEKNIMKDSLDELLDQLGQLGLLILNHYGVISFLIRVIQRLKQLIKKV